MEKEKYLSAKMYRNLGELGALETNNSFPCAQRLFSKSLVKKDNIDNGTSNSRFV